MIKEKEILIQITKFNKHIYKKMGYVPENIDDFVYIKIEDFGKQSQQRITAICELCGSETSISIQKYYVNKKRSGYYGCRKCSRTKFKKTNILKYGSEHYMSCLKIKEKIANSNMEKYGVKTTLLEKITKDKIDKTKLERYGTIEVLSSKEIRDKAKPTMLAKYGEEHYSRTVMFKNLQHDSWKINLIDRLKNHNILDYVINDDNTLDIKCCCGEEHYFNITYKNLYQRKMIQHSTLCTICNPLQKSYSAGEKEVCDFIKQHYVGNIIEQDKIILNGSEIDIYLPDINFGIEYNGVFWHNETFKETLYHHNKSNICYEQNIQLFHLWEDEWHNKKDLIISILKRKMKIFDDVINSDDCELRYVTDIKEVRLFLTDNHIEGFIASNIKLGLYYGDKLVSLILFKKLKNGYQLLRHCDAMNTEIIDGFERLFNYFIDEYNPENIVSYLNRDYFGNEIYLKNNFKLDGITSVDYFYVNCTTMDRVNKFNCRKSSLIKEGGVDIRTESEIMSDNGYSRIFDSGCFKLVWNK